MTTMKMACPNCGKHDQIAVHMLTWYHVDDMGQGEWDYLSMTEAEDTADGPYTYDLKSPAYCQACDHQAPFENFWRAA